MGSLVPAGVAGLVLVLAGTGLVAVAPAGHAEDFAGALTQEVRVQPRAATFDDTYFEAGSVTVSGGNSANPATLAIDETDDTVYVANYDVGTVEVLSPGQVSGAPIATVAVKAGGAARLAGIAVDSDDDTIFVTDRTDSLPKQVWAINARTLTVDDTVSVDCTAGNHNGNNNWEIAVNSRTNIVYVPCFAGGATGRVVALNSANLDDSAVYTNAGDMGYRGIAIDPVDDSLYIAGEWGSQVVQRLQPADPPTSSPPLVLEGTLSGSFAQPRGVALLDDTIYVSNMNANHLVAINITSASSSNLALPDQEGTDVAAFAAKNLLFVTSNTQRVWLLSASDGTLQQTFAPSGFRASSVVVSSSGAAYVGSYASDVGAKVVKVFAPAAPGASTGVSGTAGYEQVAVNWSGPAYTGASAIQWYRVTASPGGKTCIAQAPATTCVVGGLTAGTPYTFTVQAMNSTGSWGPTSAASGAVTPLAPPSPGPGPAPTPIAPGVPRDASATAGDERARVTWTVPSYAGSGPISVYRVTASPGGETCFVDAPATACTVRDLINGTPYTFRVQALNEGGWSQPATTSPVTPQGPSRPHITLDPGERTANGINDLVSTRGETTGIPAGSRLTPYVRSSREGEYRAGVADVVVSADGSFRWSREVRKSKPLFAYMVYERAESNTVVWVRLSGRSGARGR